VGVPIQKGPEAKGDENREEAEYLIINRASVTLSVCLCVQPIRSHNSNAFVKVFIVFFSSLI